VIFPEQENRTGSFGQPIRRNCAPPSAAKPPVFQTGGFFKNPFLTGIPFLRIPFLLEVRQICRNRKGSPFCLPVGGMPSLFNDFSLPSGRSGWRPHQLEGFAAFPAMVLPRLPIRPGGERICYRKGCIYPHIPLFPEDPRKQDGKWPVPFRHGYKGAGRGN